jgi:hypothetical protein
MSPQTAKETAKAVVEKKSARAAPGLNVSPIDIPPKLSPATHKNLPHRQT